MLIKKSLCFGGILLGALVFPLVTSDAVTAVTITNVKINSFNVPNSPVIIPKGQKKVQVLISGTGQYSWTGAKTTFPFDTAKAVQKITIQGDPQKTTGTNIQQLLKASGTNNDSLFFSPLLGVGNYTTSYSFSVNPSDKITKSFKVPEPLTFLGSLTAIGTGIAMKKKITITKKVRVET